jgi:peptidoglycan/xylan/chitin deacetylase (PgdA/CDA1 family)
VSPHLPTARPYVGSQRAALNFVGATLWHLPGSFGIVRILGSRYSLRCVLFHDVSDAESSFSRGLGGTISRKDFEATLKFLTKHYTPVSLHDVLASFEGRHLPLRSVLVTFDDAYASVAEFAAPLCASFGVPAVFFINASCLDNRQLALDNLVCYVANVFGLDTINAAIRTVTGSGNWEVHSLAEVFARFLPSISLPARRTFRDGLVRLAQISESDLAEEAGLYLSSQQLRDLATFNFEIGNHTYTHVNCRSLLADEFAQEIDQNRVTLEAISGQKVRTFSVPYGASADLTTKVLAHLQRSGYEANFLAEGGANSPHTQPWVLDRVSIKARGNAALFSEIEVLPRLRITRNRLLATSKWASDRRDFHLENATPTPSRHAPIECTETDTAGPRGTLGL